MSLHRPKARSGLSPGARLGHRLALTASSVCRPRRPAAPDEQTRIAFLLMNAGSMSGIVRTVFNLAEYLAASHDVEIVSVTRRRRRSFFPLPEGVRVTVVDDHVSGRTSRRIRPTVRHLLRRVPGSLIHPADRQGKRSSLWTDLMLVRRLRRLDADVIISTRYSLTVIAARLARPGVVVIAQEHIHLGMKSTSKLEAIRDAYPRLDAVVVLTQTDQRDYEALLGGRSRVVCIPNACPTPGGPASDGSQTVILGAGRLTRQKGFDRLIAAFARVTREEPEWTLRICGIGPENVRLRRLAVKHGGQDRVEMPGRVKDMATEMQQASIFALSSRFEGFPMVLLEAMSKGLPVVAFDCPTGPADIIEDGRTGLLVPDGDVNAFAAGLLDLIRDAAKRRTFGAAGAERAAAFSIERVGAAWEELLRELLDARRPSSRA